MNTFNIKLIMITNSNRMERLTYKYENENEFNKDLRKILKDDLYRNIDSNIIPENDISQFYKREYVNLINTYIQLNDEQLKHISSMSASTSTIDDYYEYYKSQGLTSFENNKVFVRNKKLPLDKEVYQKYDFSLIEAKYSSSKDKKDLIKRYKETLKTLVTKYGENIFENSQILPEIFLGMFSQRTYKDINSIEPKAYYSLINLKKFDEKEIDEIIDLYFYRVINSENYSKMLEHKHEEKLSGLEMSRSLIKELKEKNVFPLNYDDIK